MGRQSSLVVLSALTLMMVSCGNGEPIGTTVTSSTTTQPPGTTTTTSGTTTTTTPPPTTTSTTHPLPQSTNPPDVASCPTPETCSHPLIETARWEVPVLSISFLPDADSDGVIDFEATNWTGSVGDLRHRVRELNNAGAWWATEATRYRGEGSTGTDPSLGFRIVDQIEFETSVPEGLPVPWNPGWFRPDYLEILTGIEVCRWVDGLGVREIWMWTQHHGRIEPVESNMSSRFGDISNSEGSDDLPACGHSYTLYNFNFGRTVAEMLHNRGHQAERLFQRADPTLWSRFVGDIGSIGNPNTVYRCGNTHFPPNAESDYDYVNPGGVMSNCFDWRPDGDLSQTVDCGTWFNHVYGDDRCFDDGGLAFYVWWFQAIPGWDNGLTFQNMALVDWWLLFADLESAATDSRSWLTQ